MNGENKILINPDFIKKRYRDEIEQILKPLSNYHNNSYDFRYEINKGTNERAGSLYTR